MKRIHLSPPHMGAEERELLLEAFDSNWIAPAGPHLERFESELAATLGVGHAAALSSGTAALHLALVILGVGPKDRVLTSTMTFAATVNAIRYVGAEPVLVDCDRATWTMDPRLVAEELAQASTEGRLPKAAIAVDVYGQCADYDALGEICSRYDVPLIADASESLGATYRGRAAGSQGAMGVVSFNGNKIITAGGGGMLVSNHEDWIDRARHLSAYARDPAPHYEHSEIGFSYRMNNLLASIGRAQLRRLEDRVARRRAVNRAYRDALGPLPGIDFMPEAPYGTSSCWLTAITIDPPRFGIDRDTVMNSLDERAIEARPVFKPMHLQPVFKDCRIVGGSVSAGLFDVGLCLPSGSSLGDTDLDRITGAIREARRAKVPSLANDPGRRT